MLHFLELATAYAVADALVIAAVLHIAFGVHQHPLSLKFPRAVIQSATLVLALVTFQSYSTSPTGILAAVAVAVRPLAVQHACGRILFQLTGLLGIYRGLLGTDSSIWPRVVIALLHAYLLLSNLSPGDWKTVRIYMDKVLYAEEWRLMRLNQIRTIKLEDIQKLPERLRLQTTYGELKYNVDEPLFLIRAVIRMIWRPMLSLSIIQACLYSTNVVLIATKGVVYRCLDSPNEYPWFYGYAGSLGYLVAGVVDSQWGRVYSLLEVEIERATNAVKMEIFRQPLIASTKQTTRRQKIPDDLIEDLLRYLRLLQLVINNSVGIIAAFLPIYYYIGYLAFIPLAISTSVSLAEEILRMAVGDQYHWEKDSFIYFSDVDGLYSSIKLVKYFGWEKMFLSRKIQEREFNEGRQPWYGPIVWYAWEVIYLANIVAGHLSSYIVIQMFINRQSAAAAATAITFTSADILQLSSHIDLLRWGIEIFMNYAPYVRKIVHLNIKIEGILRGEHLDTLPQYGCVEGKSCPSVTLDNCDFRWNKFDQIPVLSDITFSATAGGLVAVTGKAGSGKTSLLWSICGEMEHIKGTGGVVGTVGYLEQDPWIMNASFRDNVVFGREYEKGLFDRVVYSCALTEDIAQWPERDLTIIGDRGVNISGGQRARLALARALYSQADIYVLDDPLSAVDAHVKRHLLEHVILDTGMLAGKLRIVSTHVKNFLPYAHQVIELSDGKATVTQQKPRIYNLDLLHEPVNDDSSPCNLGSLSEDLCADASGDDVGTDSTAASEENNSVSDQEDDDDENDKGELLKHSIWANAMYVFQFCGLPVVAIVFVLSIAKPVTKFVLDERELHILHNSNGSHSSEAMLHYLYLGMLNSALSKIIERVGEVLLEHVSARYLNERFKREFTKSLVHAPMSLFDSTTRQRVSSAFDKGACAVAEGIPEFMTKESSMVVSVILSLWQIGHSAPMLLAIIPIAAVAVYQRDKLVASTKDALQLLQNEAQIKSNHIRDIVADGQHIIRMFGVESHFTSIYMEDMDHERHLGLSISSLRAIENTAAALLTGCGEMLVTCILLAQTIFTAYPVTSGEFSKYQQLLESLIESTARVVNLPSRTCDLSNGVDRFRLWGSIPAEAPYVVEDCRPPPNWPENGHIEFRNFSMKYREDLDASLKEINLDVRPGEKIGIVGRTGSGKSSLAKSLFRLAGPHTTGNILIDGQDISAMGVGDLRSRLRIVPQETTIFMGSYQKNLDPLYKYSIEEVWAAIIKGKLAKRAVPVKRRDPPQEDYYEYIHKEKYEEYKKEVGMMASFWAQSGWAMRLFLFVFAASPQKPQKSNIYMHGLGRWIYYGDGFSSGEKQLLGMCRILVRKQQVVVLDEATAKVDLETDAELQDLIKTEFRDCTVFTIAHRLETIMNSDRIVVMDQGRAVEVGPPQQLIAKGGYFADLVKTNEL